MADYYTKLSFTFDVSATEGNYLASALAHEWDDEDLAIDPSLAPVFTNRQQFIELIFADQHDDPYFNLDEFSVENGVAWIAACECPNIEAIATLIQHICRESLKARPIGFEWANDCNKLRADAFGGGWCLIEADSIEWGSTSQALRSALASVIKAGGEIDG